MIDKNAYSYYAHTSIEGGIIGCMYNCMYLATHTRSILYKSGQKYAPFNAQYQLN